MREQERRQQIMRAAEQLFASRRFHEITTDEIAATAGIGKGTIYRYFKNKEELFYETALGGFEEVCNLLSIEDDKSAPLEKRLRRACARIDGFFRKRRRLFGLMQAEENRLALKRGRMRRNWRERRRRLTDILAVILADAAERGEIATDIPPDHLAALLLGMLKSTAHRLDTEDRENDPIPEVIELFLHGAVGQ